MTPETLFGQAGMIAMLGWTLLMFGPRRFAWLNAVPALVLPATLSTLYALLVLTSFSGAEGGFGSLAEVRALFADDWVLLAGWVHYLAFDLLVGAVMAARLDRAGVGRLVQAPVLVLIFLLGPLGALLALLTEGALRLPSLAPLSSRRSGPLAKETFA
jgi:hypothetical protein